jgi:capsid protein
MVKLQPGQNIEFTEPPPIDAAFDPFVRAQMRRIAAGWASPTSCCRRPERRSPSRAAARGCWSSSAPWRAIQYGLLIPLFCEPVLRRWAELARAVGVLPVDADAEVRRWVAPEIEMLDRRAEVLTDLLRVRAGFASRSEIIGRTGWRSEDVDPRSPQDNARADALGLTFDSDARKRTQQGQDVPAEQGAEQ